jgi:hypothetical protein
MKQELSWQTAALVIAGVVLLVGALFYFRGAASGRAQPHISPQFLQLSPADQKAALEAAEGARRRRGAPPIEPGR